MGRKEEWGFSVRIYLQANFRIRTTPYIIIITTGTDKYGLRLVDLAHC